MPTATAYCPLCKSDVPVNWSGPPYAVKHVYVNGVIDPADSHDRHVHPVTNAPTA